MKPQFELLVELIGEIARTDPYGATSPSKRRRG
jgi:hypothetical protein